MKMVVYSCSFPFCSNENEQEEYRLHLWGKAGDNSKTSHRLELPKAGVFRQGADEREYRVDARTLDTGRASKAHTFSMRNSSPNERSFKSLVYDVGKRSIGGKPTHTHYRVEKKH